jgi:hypothetical protein
MPSETPRRVHEILVAPLPLLLTETAGAVAQAQVALDRIRRGDEVAIVGRNADKGAAFLDLAERTGAAGRAHFVEADLGLVADTRAAIAEIRSLFPAVDALVLCARHYRSTRAVTEEGVEYRSAKDTVKVRFEREGYALEKERNDAILRNVKHKAYPVQVHVGLVFAYMGPEPVPPMPHYDTLFRRDGRRTITVHPQLDCNWFQAMENSVDPAHLQVLHQEYIGGNRKPVNTTRSLVTVTSPSSTTVTWLVPCRCLTSTIEPGTVQ